MQGTIFSYRSHKEELLHPANAEWGIIDICYMPMATSVVGIGFWCRKALVLRALGVR